MRGGVDVAGGVGTGAGGHGIVFGAKARLGWQVDDRLGAYLQASIFKWNNSPIPLASGGTATGSFGFNLTPMGSVIFGRLIELAAGPSLDGLGATSFYMPVSPNTGRRGYAIYGFDFGAHGRAALHLHSAAEPHASLAIGADLHTTFASGTVVTFFTLGIGADWH